MIVEEAPSPRRLSHAGSPRVDWRVTKRSRYHVIMMRLATVDLRRAIIAAFALIAVTIAVQNAARAEPAQQPVLVELFTSQGCSSCPPADAFLAELAERPGVLALSYHVDYWNYIGWTDPFSSPEATARQRAYGKTLGSRVAYTPQMVIDGRHDAVGSHRETVEQAIAAAAASPHVALVIAGDDATGYRAVLPATALDMPARIWLVLFDGSHETTVTRGENTGRTIENRNVVRGIVDLAAWDGSATEIPLALDPALTAGRDNCAVIVQEGKAGPVLATAVLGLAE